MAYDINELNLEDSFSTDSSELFGTNLDWVEVDEIRGEMLNNKILVEVETFLYDKIKTESGLVLWSDNSYQISQYAVRSGVVRMIPEKLVSWKESKQGMSWITDMNLRIGDLVWMYGMSSFSGEKLLSKGKKYVIVSFEDLYIAKRGDEIIPLNGNVLLIPILKTEKALSYTKEYICPDFAIVAYIGENNTEYEFEYRADDPNIKQGQTVCISGLIPRRLELEPYLLLDGKTYLVCQNHEIQGWLD
jgi:co-chaperonin GroES (HSP10)